MNYIFKGVSYDQDYLSSMPTVVAEVEIVPRTPKEWRDVHKILNSTNFEEIRQLTSMFNSRPTLPSIKNVYFNDPVTVVLWDDGSKTIVKCQDGDTYSRETGLALCISKKALGNKPNFNDIFKKWIPEEKKPTSERLCSNCKYRDRIWGGGDESCFECAVHGDRRFWKPKK